MQWIDFSYVTLLAEDYSIVSIETLTKYYRLINSFGLLRLLLQQLQSARFWELR